MATRPLSALKRWRLVKVLSLAEVSIEEYQEALAQEEILEEIEEATKEVPADKREEVVVEETKEEPVKEEQDA